MRDRRSLNMLQSTIQRMNRRERHPNPLFKLRCFVGSLLGYRVNLEMTSERRYMLRPAADYSHSMVPGGLLVMS